MSADPTHSRRVLVIDDTTAIHEDFRKILCEHDPVAAAEDRLFERSGLVPFSVDVALQGLDGVNAVRNAIAGGRPYAVAFVDVRMPPGCDGIETTRRLWEVDPDLQVVLCTAYSDYSWNEIRDALGPSDRLLILKKPFESIEVIQLAHALSEKWRLLQESRETLSAVVESLPGIFYVVDEHGRFLRWNKTLENVSGFDAAAIGAMSAYDLVVAPQHELVTEKIHDVLTAGEQVVELSLAARDRTQTPYLVAGTTGIFEGRRCIIGFGTDISALKRAESELRLQSAALNAAANAIAITDRDGTIVWINRGFTGLTGYGEGDAVGQNIRALKSGLREQPLAGRVWSAVGGGQVWRGELTSRRQDGRAYVEELVITPVQNDHGDITHFIAITHDLTARKALEAQFLQAQKMEVVGRLAGGIAHDFNNLLTVINGAAESAAATLPAGDPLGDDLREIHQAGTRAALLTRQLLAFSRKQVMNPKVVNLAALVDGLRGMLQRVIGEDIRLAGPGPCAGLVKVDPGQIEQVIMNLAVNARDAMPLGGTLTIDVQAAPGDGSQDVKTPHVLLPPSMLLTVTDTGTGMDEFTKSRLFEPFFTTKEVGKGSGLGLCTVHGIIKQSGGSISVVSDVGRGTTFSISLPRVDPAATASAPPLSAPAAGGKETILVVEDEDGVRRMACRMLESSGYHVLAASGGAEAIRLLEQHPDEVRLMLTDVVMPSMNGPELAARVAAMRPLMKVVYTSGYTDSAALRDMVFHAAVHFVGKPYTKQDLARVVREALDQSTGTPSTHPAGEERLIG